MELYNIWSRDGYKYIKYIYGNDKDTKEEHIKQMVNDGWKIVEDTEWRTNILANRIGIGPEDTYWVLCQVYRMELNEYKEKYNDCVCNI